MEGRGVRRSRDGDFQEPIVLPLAGRHTPVFLGALDKLHTHFVLSELHQEPRRRDIESKEPFCMEHLPRSGWLAPLVNLQLRRLPIKNNALP